MTKDEIRKLLGGYATNTLTESERSTLFQAALDDQELFDALQREQALKNILDDPSARAEIREALDRPRSVRSPWWIWGSAIGAAAAAVVLIAVFWPRANVLLEERKEIASLEKSTASSNPRAVTPPVSPNSPSPVDSLKQASQPASRARVPRPAAPRNQPLESGPAAPVPAPVIPSPVIAQDAGQQQAQGAVALSQGIQSRDQTAGARSRNSFAPMATVAGVPRSSLRYSLVKQDTAARESLTVSGSDLKPGDRIRVRVSAAIPGRIVLQHLDAAGGWQPIANAVPEPNSEALVPSDPIVVTTEAQRFRLLFEPILPAAKSAETVGQLQAPTVSSPIEITIVASTR
jgi:hypothetical protein